MKDDRLYLSRVFECVSRIQEYTQAGREDFLKSHVVQDAVLRNLQIMTESCQRLSPELKSRHPEIDWRGLSGFRNILVHVYLGVDLEIVWALIEKKLSALHQMASNELR